MKELKQVKAESFTNAELTDNSFTIVNFHLGSGFGGACIILGVIALIGAGYALARICAKRKAMVRRAATTLEVIKSPA